MDASKNKWWCTELAKKVIDQRLQLHGGYGFMNEYAVGRAYCDSRIQTIFFGGTVGDHEGSHRSRHGAVATVFVACERVAGFEGTGEQRHPGIVFRLWE